MKTLEQLISGDPVIVTRKDGTRSAHNVRQVFTLIGNNIDVGFIGSGGYRYQYLFDRVTGKDLHGEGCALSPATPEQFQEVIKEESERRLKVRREKEAKEMQEQKARQALLDEAETWYNTLSEQYKAYVDAIGMTHILAKD